MKKFDSNPTETTEKHTSGSIRSEKPEDVLYGQVEVLELISQGAPLRTILETITHWVEEESCEDLLASILLADPSGKFLLHGAAPNIPDEYNKAIHGIRIAERVGSCGTAAFARKVVIVEDIQTDPLWEEFRDIAQKYGLRACWSTPLMTKDDKVLGTFAIYYKKQKKPTSAELQLIRLASRTAVLAIEYKHAEEERAQLVINEKKINEKIKEERRQFYQLFMNSPALLAVLQGPEHIFQHANTSYIHAVAGKRNILGLPVRVALPELKGQGIYDLLDHVFTSGRSYSELESNIKLARTSTNNLEDAYFNFVFQPLKTESGVVDGILVHAVDVTEQVRARKIIEISEQRFRNLITHATVATAIYEGPKMIIQYANDAMVRLWGKDKSVIGKPLRDAIPELEGQPFHELLNNVYRTGKTYWGTGEPVHLNIDGKGQTGYYNFSYKALRNEVGEIYGILNMAIDVTAQVLAKNQVEESERNFRNFVMQAPVGICIVRAKDLVVELSNDQFLEIAGKKREELVGKPIWSGLPEAKNQGFEQLLKNVMITGNSFHAGEHETTVIRNGKSERIYVDFVYQPLKEADGSVSSIMAAAIEVTNKVIARKKIEEAVAERTKQLRDANAHLERSNEELEQFAYVASHDLQEPLRKIKTFATLISDSAEIKSDKHKLYIDKIISSSERMSGLIKDILNFSKLTTTGEEWIPTDLNRILKNVLEDFEMEIENKKAIIKADVLPTIDSIPLQMNQLFFNLVGNSLKFTREGVAPVIRIAVHPVTDEERKKYNILRQDKAYFKLIFTDNGIGFDQKYGEKIFTIFQRLNAKTFPGTGIGLALCRRIVNNHGGEIYGESTEGNGATFHILLPL